MPEFLFFKYVLSALGFQGGYRKIIKKGVKYSEKLLAKMMPHHSIFVIQELLLSTAIACYLCCLAKIRICTCSMIRHVYNALDAGFLFLDAEFNAMFESGLGAGAALASTA